MRELFIQIITPIIILFSLLLLYWRIRLKKLGEYQSPILGKIEVLQKYNGEKVLTIGAYPQGVSIEQKSIIKSYWYTIADETIKFCRNRKNPQILMLGLGANTIPNLIAKMNPEIHQVIIEIDKFVIAACRKFFDLDKLPNYQLIQTDAFKWATQEKSFDVIIVDIFIGKPPFVSLESNKPSFIEKIIPLLKNNGMIIFNRPGHNKEAQNDSQKLHEYIKTKFQKTKLLDIKDPRRFRNNIIVGSTKK